MKKQLKKLYLLFLACMLAFFLVGLGGIARAQQPAPADTNTTLEALGAVGNASTYQGQLKDANRPVTGSYTTLFPRQPLTSTPYALSSAMAGTLDGQHGVDTTYAHFFLQDPTISDPWWHSHTVVDASGGIHLAFYDTNNIYYAHCAVNCSDPANWLELPLFSAGMLSSLDEPTLGVDANGRPRLMWYADYSGDAYYYAECNDGCTDSAANWNSVEITSIGAYGYPQNTRYAALDTQGRPRLVYPQSNYPDYGINYLSCDSGCTNASHWITTTVTTPGLEPDALQIVFDPNDQPRVVGYDNNSKVLVYAECNSDCTTAGNWGSVGLSGLTCYFMDECAYVLRVDSQGHPRIAYYSDDASNNVLHYTWSNASPLTPGGWSSYTLNYPANYTEWSLDLSLDSQGRPSVAYATNTLDMSYITCTANCEANSPTWQQQYIETEDDLNASDPIPTNPGCLSSTWMVIGYPSLSLDAANEPSVSYWVRHGQLCNNSIGALTILYDAESIRFATAGGPVQNGHKVYLPLVVR